MPAKIEHLGPCEKLLEVNISAERIHTALERSFGELRNQVNLPGFRAGRVPRSLLERRFGDSVRGEVLQELVDSSIRDALEDHELEPVGQPEFGRGDEEGDFRLELPKEGDLDFAFRVEIRPSFELPDLKGLSATREVLKVTDEDVDRVLSRLAERAGEHVPVEDESATYESGDLVTADTTVTLVEGQEALIAGEARTFSGEHPHVDDYDFPDLATALEGRKVGDKIEVEGVVTDRCEDESRRGASVSAVFELDGLKRLEALKLDDELAERVGKESIEELRTSVREDLEKMNREAADGRLQRELVDTLLGQVEIPVAPKLLERAVNAHHDAMRRELGQGGLGREAIDAKVEEHRERTQSEAERELRANWLLQSLSKKLKIFALEEDFLAEYQRIADENGVPVASVQSFYQREGMADRLREDVLERKTMTALVERAEITESEVDDLGEDETDGDEKPAQAAGASEG